MWFLLVVLAGVGLGLSQRLDGVATRLLIWLTLAVVGLYGLRTGAF